MANAVEKLTLAASAARTATGNSEWFPTPESGAAVLYLDITAVSGSTPTLDITIEVRDPLSGQTYTLATITQQTGVANLRQTQAAFPDAEVRAVWTIGGGSPSFTFTLAMVLKDD